MNPNWTWRRLTAVLLLAVLFAPVLPALAAAVPAHHDHAGHHGGATAVSVDEQSPSVHDRLACSIVIPCDHGFCAGMAMLPDAPDGDRHREPAVAHTPKMGSPATPESRSPPPKRLV